MLPFTRHEFFTVFESYNTAVWPAQLFLYALAVAMVVWAARRRQRTDRWIPFALAALWLWAASPVADVPTPCRRESLTR